MGTSPPFQTRLCLSPFYFVRAPSRRFPPTLFFSAHFLSCLCCDKVLHCLCPPCLLICRREGPGNRFKLSGQNWEFLKLVWANRVFWVSGEWGELFTCLQSGICCFLCSFSRFCLTSLLRSEQLDVKDAVNREDQVAFLGSAGITGLGSQCPQ